MMTGTSSANSLWAPEALNETLEGLCNCFAKPWWHTLDFPASAARPMDEAQQFESFLRDYQNMVFSTAMRLLANQSEAEDVTQEVFLRAFQRFGELKTSPTAGGWLKTVATNLSLNHLSRYRSRWSFFSEMFRGGEYGEEEGEVEFAAATDVAAEMEGADRKELVEKALASLPPGQRVPLVLYHMEGLQYDEIATKLGISMGKVKTDIFRGREALRRKLKLKLDEEPSEAAV
jgi:RNA polymerase sigma-70 factor (ECF subfamily)